MQLKKIRLEDISISLILLYIKYFFQIFLYIAFIINTKVTVIEVGTDFSL